MANYYTIVLLFRRVIQCDILHDSAADAGSVAHPATNGHQFGDR